MSRMTRQRERNIENGVDFQTNERSMRAELDYLEQQKAKEPKLYKPTCLQCGKKTRQLAQASTAGMGVGSTLYFCSVKCAAKWAVYRAAATQEWCGVRYEDAPDSDCEGPHGWHSESNCPECEAVDG